MVAVEAIYLFDEHNNPLLDFVYTGRPPSAAVLLPQYLAHSAPRPSLIYLPSLNPPTLLFSLIHDRLLFLCPTSADIEPLLVLEFLHRVADALEEFLGSPLLASKIDGSYDVVVQIIGEMSDAGVVCNTEPNALKEVVEVPSWMGSILGGFGLPASSPSLGASNALPSQFGPGIGSSSSSSNVSSTGSAIPWRRSNVRHTSNELYVDIVEKLSVILAPSGRPLSAFANGTIVFTAKISGIPDLVLNLNAPGGKTGLQNAMELPCFHPCVRLARWRDRPGELSFVPPDGRFVLASYECNLLPEMFTLESEKIPAPNLNLPASIEIRPSLGHYGDELEVRLLVSSRGLSGSNASLDPTSAVGRTLGNSSRFSGPSSGLGTGISTSSPAVPTVQDIVVTIPLANTVRNVDDLRSSKGEAHFLASESYIEWRIPNRDVVTIGSSGATLRCVLVGPIIADDGAKVAAAEPALATKPWDYDEHENSTSNGSYQTSNETSHASKTQNDAPSESQESKRRRQGASLMPRSANLSFSVKGWLASGVKVESLNVSTKTSKGLGAGVTPYKGVKYHTVSQQGIEARC